MGVKVIKAYSVTCDDCEISEDTVGEYFTTREVIGSYEKDGWTWSCEKFYCPDCSVRRRRNENT